MVPRKCGMEEAHLGRQVDQLEAVPHVEMRKGEKEKKEAREEKMEVQWLSSCVVVEMAKLEGTQKACHQACPLEPS